MDNFNDAVVSKSIKIKEVISTIEKSHTKIALVVDEDYRLIATVSDGDIRRGILKGLSLDTSVSEIANFNYKSVKKNIPREQIIELMKKNDISQMPIIDKNKKLLGLHLLNELLEKRSFNNNVVIMAGGKGLRLRPLTEDCPKPMLKIGEKPLLELIIEQFTKSGFKNFLISVNYLKEQIFDHFGDGSKWDINIKYLVEEQPLGTAGSLNKLPNNINGPYFVINGDVLSNFNPIQVLDFHNSNKADITICAHNYEYSVPYGVIKTKGIELEKIIEKPNFNHLINAGVYVMDSKVNNLIKENVYTDMPDLINISKEKDLKIIIFPIHEYWLDIGRQENLLEARNRL